MPYYKWKIPKKEIGYFNAEVVARSEEEARNLALLLDKTYEAQEYIKVTRPDVWNYGTAVLTDDSGSECNSIIPKDERIV